MRRWWPIRAPALAAACLYVGATAAADTLQVGQLRAGRATLTELTTHGIAHQVSLGDRRTPLGSLWKLYVHAYLVDTAQVDPGYLCTGQNKDEVYCCESGEHIDRDQALVRSCGLYYTPTRLGISAPVWRTYWQTHRAPEWLLDLDQMQPATAVPIADVLATLASLPAQAELRRVLLDVPLHAHAPEVIGAVGALLRVKTYSWHLADRARIGGFAGWLVDGTPIWAGGTGTSQSLLARFGTALGSALKAPVQSDVRECVVVDLFERYPLAAVEQNGKTLGPGRLNGPLLVRFENRQELAIESSGDLLLSKDLGKLKLSARLSREEYVARVLDREAQADETQAARALSVAIRSYLQQNADRRGECLAIADSSAQQRVAPRPATATARAVAAFTADLVLTGAPIGYHRDTGGLNRLSWQEAVRQSRAGARFDQILRQAFPRAVLGRWDRPGTECQSLTAAADWLRSRLRDWRPTLDAEIGYAETREFEVCRLQSGRPSTDRERKRIYVRGLVGLQDRLDLTHEYLHLAFSAVPTGHDEDYIEALARRLLLE